MTNPLLTRSTLPYELPDWQAIRPEHLIPAVKAAMDEQVEAWEAIATNPEPATIANTVDALEDAGRRLIWTASVAYTLCSGVGGDEYDAVEAELEPMLSEHQNTYRLDRRIYERLAALDLSEVDAETATYVTEELKRFRQGGIELDDAAKDQLRSLDSQLSALEVSFAQLAVQAMADNELVITDEAELAGVPADQLAAWSQSDGSYRVPIDNYTNQPSSTQMTNPQTRRRLFDASVSRGLGEHPTSDTRQIVLDIVRLRAERAELLGYENHAALVADREMAGTPEAILDLLTPVAQHSVAGVERDGAHLANVAAADPAGDGFEAGDWMYYEEKGRAALGVDDAALRPYFELETVLNKGVFFAANRVYGLTFTPREDLAGYVDTMKTWEITNELGEPIALFQADFFRRPGKRGGAWMNSIVDASEHDGTRPLILNTCNFAEPTDGGPCLLSWDNVITMFHEFGHALHAIVSRTKYRSTGGTNVPRDFVELPSQLNEMWAWHPDVLANYAVHHATGEPLPSEMIDALVASRTYGQPFATTENVAAALLDQAWHRIGSSEIPTDIEQFEDRALTEFGVKVDLVPPRYRSCYFSHTFGGGYDAGYYSYLWADVIAADIEDWFAAQENGGFTRDAGRVYENELLSRGSSRPPMDSVRAILGREPESHALLERRGLL